MCFKFLKYSKLLTHPSRRLMTPANCLPSFNRICQSLRRFPWWLLLYFQLTFMWELKTPKKTGKKLYQKINGISTENEKFRTSKNPAWNASRSMKETPEDIIECSFSIIERLCMRRAKGCLLTNELRDCVFRCWCVNANEWAIVNKIVEYACSN